MGKFFLNSPKAQCSAITAQRQKLQHSYNISPALLPPANNMLYRIKVGSSLMA